MHDKKPSPGGRWRGEAVTDEGKGFDIRVLPSKQVKAFAPQVRRWHGAAMTDEGDHGGASVIDGMTGHDGSCRGGPLCPPVDDRRTYGTHPHPSWLRHATFPLEGGRHETNIQPVMAVPDTITVGPSAPPMTP